MSNIPSEIPKQNVMKDEFGWEIPVETVPVPSEGMVYPAGSPLHGRKTLQIKAMTAREEDILSSAALIKEGTVITHLLESCLIDKEVNVRDMLLGDRNALMVSVRITGYGSHFTLPITKKNVLFRFMTGRDEEERNIIAERKRKIMPGMKIEDGVTSRLEQLIVSIDGIKDRNKISQFVKNMPALDSRKLRGYISKYEPGIDMSTWMKCPSCSENSRISLPMGSNFFWPSE